MIRLSRRFSDKKRQKTFLNLKRKVFLAKADLSDCNSQETCSKPCAGAVRTDFAGGSRTELEQEQDAEN